MSAFCEREADVLVATAAAVLSGLMKDQIKECFHGRKVVSANRLQMDCLQLDSARAQPLFHFSEISDE